MRRREGSALLSVRRGKSRQAGSISKQFEWVMQVCRANIGWLGLKKKIERPQKKLMRQPGPGSRIGRCSVTQGLSCVIKTMLAPILFLLLSCTACFYQPVPCVLLSPLVFPFPRAKAVRVINEHGVYVWDWSRLGAIRYFSTPRCAEPHRTVSQVQEKAKENIAVVVSHSHTLNKYIAQSYRRCDANYPRISLINTLMRNKPLLDGVFHI